MSSCHGTGRRKQQPSVKPPSGGPRTSAYGAAAGAGRTWPRGSTHCVDASRFGPARPRAMGWNGAGGWVTVSQARHENRSRTVWMTFHLIGSISSVSVVSLPSLDSLPPQQGQAVGPGMTIRSRGRWAAGAPAPAGHGLGRSGRLMPRSVSGRHPRPWWRPRWQQRPARRVRVPAGRSACGRAPRRRRTCRA